MRNIFIGSAPTLFSIHTDMQPGSPPPSSSPPSPPSLSPLPSVSRFKLTIEIANKGSASGELVRHLAPLTAGTILKSLPLQDRVHRFADKFVYIETRLVIGGEKQRSQFKRGDMAYLTSNGSICIFIKDATVQPMNPLGTIVSNLEIIESSQPGDVMIVRPTAS